MGFLVPDELGPTGAEMSQSLYAVLGVEPDADRAAIRRAYRERVKERHPDTSDDPDAPAEFKRLVTARDVLADDDERARYDRLGHETYVRRHLGAEPGTRQPADDPHAEAREATRAASTRARERAGRHPRDPRRPGGTTRATRQSGPTDDWQRAAGFYRTRSSGPGDRGGNRWPGARLRRVLGSLGGWLVVHLVFVGTAVGLAWLTAVRTATVTNQPFTSLAVGALVLALAVFASAIHLASLAVT